ncbi:MAG: leucine--tRNA ligase [Nitrososphaerota archaeon]|nr:leucine--tRNA ligase [Candidatus Calditenuaceae archaeon]MDW8073008.1 leucine--tRNA ligase [Nitrososphaerota archaeon]
MRMPPRSAISYEEKWAKKMFEDKIFEADPDPDRPKIFVTFPYSYQNGPLHVGHGFTATRVDMYARYLRMKGYNVLFPWAWHWTGEAVAGTAERLKRNDPTVLRMLKEIDRVPEELLPKFTDPAFISQYYTNENREIVKLMGFSVDWRREFYTSDLHPYYSRFIEWQYLTLYELGRLRKGSHPVVWCPVCESPTGDHDRLVGEGVSPVEFTLVFFKLEGEDVYLAASTLRPETIFGATNVWVKPDAEYVVAELNEAKIVVSGEALSKLKEQHKKVSVEGKTRSGRELIGRYCTAPITGKRLIILPADFVDPNLGTGVVYSVPSHAPYDYAGIKELKLRPDKLRSFGLRTSVLEELTPLNIISTPDLPPHPAIEAVERAGINVSTDAKLEDLTQNIYAMEFYGGVLNELCGEYRGLTVRDARERVKARLLEDRLGEIMYDLPQPVICRSGDRCLVKIVEDQWFITYSDEDWKEQVRTHISRNMKIYPEGARQWFLNVVDWLRDWPCTRKTGLGTKFPFDASWKVETLSDSTVYQALYTISKYLNSGEVKPTQLNLELLDYVFRGRGDPEELSRRTGINRGIIETMREEYDYWYPVDLRVSAKELLPNHLTFYIFQHVALFPPEKWPRSVGVNGMVRIEGEEMHKSRGIFVSLKDAISRVGADATRLAIILSAEDMDDPDWKWKNAEAARKYLDNFLRIIGEYASSTFGEEWQEADNWVVSRLKLIIREIEESLNTLKTRTAASKILYETENLWRKYLRRRGGTLGPAAKLLLESWVKMLSVVAPFTAEEAWNRIGGTGYVSLAKWPSIEAPQREELILRDEVLENLIEDIRSITQTTKQKPSKVYIYVARKSMVQLIRRIAENWSMLSQRGHNSIISEIVKTGNVDRQRLQTVAKRFFEMIQSYIQRYNIETIENVAVEELNLYQSNLEYLESELGCDIQVVRAEEAEFDPLGKASIAVPLRPGIYTE